MEYPLELGYFTKNTCEAIKRVMDGKTFMNFKVRWGSFAGNCTLTVETDYDADPEEIKRFFLNCALTELAKGH